MTTISRLDPLAVEIRRPAEPTTTPTADTVWTWDLLDLLLLPLALFLAGPARRYSTTGRRRRTAGDVPRVVSVKWRDPAGTVHTDAVATGWTRPEADAR